MAKVRFNKRFDRGGGKKGYCQKGEYRKEKGRLRKDGSSPGRERVKLAIALDSDLERAIEVANEVSAYVDWFFLSSSLIESRGMRAVWEVSSAFPGREIMVDLGSCAVSGRRASVAFMAGADLVVLPEGAAAKICGEAVGSARIFGGKAVLDVRGALEPSAAAAKGSELGFDCLLVRIGAVFHGSGDTWLRALEEAGLPLIVEVESGLDAAGPNGCPTAAVLAGAAITAAPNPASAAAGLKDLIRSIAHPRRAA